MSSWLEWGKAFFTAAVSLLFLAMGIDILVAAYRVTNPLYFIMTFFSSCLIIMISIVGVLYPTIRMYNHLKRKR